MDRIEIYDMQHSLEEDRYNMIGMVEDVLLVVYTERKEKTRLISARLATEKDRSLYLTELSNGTFYEELLLRNQHHKRPRHDTYQPQT